MTHLPPAISTGTLREGFIADMTVCGFTDQTRTDYFRIVATLAASVGRSPGTATTEDIRWFQIEQSDRGINPAA